MLVHLRYLICLLLLVNTYFTAHAQYSEYEIKAVMITKFAKYITWPDKVFKNEVIKIGILGDDPFGSIIDEVTQGRTIKGLRWEIIRGIEVDDVRGAHIIFIGQSMENRIRAILDDIYKNRRGSTVLTIGDNIEFFCELGGMMNYRPGERKYLFDLNVEAVTRAGLVIDVKLLDFANEIVPDTN